MLRMSLFYLLGYSLSFSLLVPESYCSVFVDSVPRCFPSPHASRLTPTLWDGIYSWGFNGSLDSNSSYAILQAPIVIHQQLSATPAPTGHKPMFKMWNSFFSLRIPFGIPISFLSVASFFIILSLCSISFQRQCKCSLFREVFSHLIHLLKKHLTSSYKWQDRERVENKTDAICALIEPII